MAKPQPEPGQPDNVKYYLIEATSENEYDEGGVLYLELTEDLAKLFIERMRTVKRMQKADSSVRMIRYECNEPAIIRSQCLNEALNNRLSDEGGLVELESPLEYGEEECSDVTSSYVEIRPEFIQFIAYREYMSTLTTSGLVEDQLKDFLKPPETKKKGRRK